MSLLFLFRFENSTDKLRKPVRSSQTGHFSYFQDGEERMLGATSSVQAYDVIRVYRGMTEEWYVTLQPLYQAVCCGLDR